MPVADLTSILTMQGWELASQSGIIRFNLSEPGGILDGVTISESQTPLGVRSVHATGLTGVASLQRERVMFRRPSLP